MAPPSRVLTFAYGLGATLLTHFLAERMRANRWWAGCWRRWRVFLIGFGVRLALSKPFKRSKESMAKIFALPTRRAASAEPPPR